MERNKKSLIYFTIILYLLAFGGSFLLKVDFITLFSVAIVGLVFSIVALKDERVLIISGMLVSLLYYGLKDIAGVLQYLPLFITALMIADILLKRKRLPEDTIIKYLVVLSLVLGLLPLILNWDINFTNIVYSLIKRYGFIIIYIYMVCSNVEYKKIYSMLTNILKIIVIINIPLFIVQFIAGVDRDFICGLFGDNMTGIVMQLILILLAVKVKDYYYKQIGLGNLFMWIIISIGYSAIAEVKFGFFVTAVFVLVFFVFIQRNFKSILIIGALGVLFSVGYVFYMQYYSSQDFLDKDFVKMYLVEMNYSGDSINRFGFKKKLDVAMNSNTVDKLVGTGIGSGNPSNFSFLRGSVNEKYDRLKYYWFSVPYLYVETGILGTAIMILLYLYILGRSYINFLKNNDELALLAFLVNIINFMFAIYSDALVNYTTLFITWSYFALAQSQRRHKGEVVLIEHEE